METDQTNFESKGPALVAYSEDHGSPDLGQSLYRQALSMDPERRDIVAKRVKSRLDGALLSMVSIQLPRFWSTELQHSWE